MRVERTAPSRWRRRLQTIAIVNVVIGFLFVPSAVANPFCYIPMVCEAKAAIDFVKDPLGFLLQKLTEANIWFLRKMLELIQATTKIDLTSPGFLKQYAIIFAASSLLTVALWLIAVAKRAVRGVGITTAMGEAIGFLLLQFVVNAMTPGALALLLKAIDEVTAVFEPYATENFKPFLENILKVMAANPSEGVGQLLVVNLIMMAGALLMWIELLIRSAAIYVAVALGPVVNAGLVDRDLWNKSKKWFGAIFAIGLSKPVLFALLGLGGAVLSDSTGSMSDQVSKTLVGALILLLAVFASATLYKWLPEFGDHMAQLHHDRKTAQSSGPAAAIDGPGQHANRAINSRVQDALVGGGGKSAGVKAAGAKMGGGTAAAGGPVAVGAAVAKAGLDMAKNKAASSPGAQGSDAANGGLGQAEDSSHTGAPGAPTGTSSSPVVGSSPDWSAANGHAGSEAPATAQPGGTASGSVVGSAPDWSAASSHAASEAPATARSQGGAASGPVVGPAPAPSGGGAASDAPATARPQGTGSGPVIGPARPAASGSPAPARPTGTGGAPSPARPLPPQAPPPAPAPPAPGPSTAHSSPSPAPRTTSGPGPSVSPAPPSRPTGGQAPGRPDPSKDR
ncbi:membrane protein [Streptomyces sp. XY593]|nr:membrane protein [Streptomyces sp. XY593]